MSRPPAIAALLTMAVSFAALSLPSAPRRVAVKPVHGCIIVMVGVHGHRQETTICSPFDR